MSDKWDSVAVNQIVDHIRSGKLFSEPSDLHALEEIPCWIIDSLEVDETYRYQDPDADDAMIEEPMNWSDILGSTDQEYYSATRSWQREDHSLFDRTSQAILSEIRSLLYKNGLNSLFGEEGANDATAMIDSIIRHRAVCGVIPGHMKETMWTILQFGGLPCGWYGGKEGMLAVFVPSMDK